MSTTDTTPTETYRCGECGAEHDPYATVHGSFCSYQCYYRHNGRAALRQIKHDHTLCSTCFRPVKSIQPPQENHPDCVIGWQFPTETMVRAIDEFQTDAADNWRTEEAPADRIERTRWSCVCGAVDTRHRYDELEAADPALVMVSAARTLAQLASEDTIGGSFDRDRYKAACRDHYRFTREVGVYGTDWVDWEYVFGVSLYGP